MLRITVVTWNSTLLSSARWWPLVLLPPWRMAKLLQSHRVLPCHLAMCAVSRIGKNCFSTSILAWLNSWSSCLSLEYMKTKGREMVLGWEESDIQRLLPYLSFVMLCPFFFPVVKLDVACLGHLSIYCESPGVLQPQGLSCEWIHSETGCIWMGRFEFI